MGQVSMDHDLVRKTLRSVTTKQETLEEIQKNYTKLFPPSFLFKKQPSISLPNLEWTLMYLEKEGYVHKEVTRYLDQELKDDTRVYSLTQKGLAYTLKKK